MAETQCCNNEDNAVIATLSIVCAQGKWFMGELGVIVEELFVEALYVHCLFLAAAVLFSCHLVVGLSVEHDRPPQPFVVLVEIAFKQQDDTKFFHIEVSWLFFQHDI